VHRSARRWAGDRPQLRSRATANCRSPRCLRPRTTACRGAGRGKQQANQGVEPRTCFGGARGSDDGALS
jgi:hypothetical protein